MNTINQMLKGLVNTSLLILILAGLVAVVFGPLFITEYFDNNWFLLLYSPLVLYAVYEMGDL